MVVDVELEGDVFLVGVNRNDGVKSELTQLQVTVLICGLCGEPSHDVNGDIAVVRYTGDAGTGKSGNFQGLGKGC